MRRRNGVQIMKASDTGWCLGIDFESMVPIPICLAHVLMEERRYRLRRMPQHKQIAVHRYMKRIPTQELTKPPRITHR